MLDDAKNREVLPKDGSSVHSHDRGFPHSKLAKEVGAHYREVSALTGENCRASFENFSLKLDVALFILCLISHCQLKKSETSVSPGAGQRLEMVFFYISNSPLINQPSILRVYFSDRQYSAIVFDPTKSVDDIVEMMKSPRFPILEYPCLFRFPLMPVS